MVDYIPSRLLLSFSTWLINAGYKLSRDENNNIMFQIRIKRKKKVETLTGIIHIDDDAETYGLNPHAQKSFYKFCEIYSYRGREFIAELEKQNPKNTRICHV